MGRGAKKVASAAASGGQAAGTLALSAAGHTAGNTWQYVKSGTSGAARGSVVGGGAMTRRLVLFRLPDLT